MKRVIDFLKENRIMTLATSYKDHPRASILEYYIVGNSIIFATGHDSIKAENLKNNKHVSMSVFADSKYVTIDGVVAEPTKYQIARYDKQLLVNHPELKDMIEKGDPHVMAYFRIIPEEAYLNDVAKGIAPPEIYR